MQLNIDVSNYYSFEKYLKQGRLSVWKMLTAEKNYERHGTGFNRNPFN